MRCLLAAVHRMSLLVSDGVLIDVFSVMKIENDIQHRLQDTCKTTSGDVRRDVASYGDYRACAPATSRAHGISLSISVKPRVFLFQFASMHRRDHRGRGETAIPIRIVYLRSATSRDCYFSG